MPQKLRGSTYQTAGRALGLGLSALGIMLLVVILSLVVSGRSPMVYADPIEPPAGYPKLTLSTKTVTPTLANTDGATLYYAIEIRNTGAYTAVGTILTDRMPPGTTYNGDAEASVDPPPAFATDTLTWEGDVGFDSTVVINFSVSVPPMVAGEVHNSAVISHPLTARPVTVTATTIITDRPILVIDKTAVPAKPGANKPITYTITVVNQGQPAVNMPITVTDRVPLSTTLRSEGTGTASPAGDLVTWTRDVTLELGEATVFTFSVDVADVPSGTVITNADYQVTSSETGVTVGKPHAVTAVDPIFRLYKEVWPDPPGSNREMTYTLTLLNVGSLATNLVITDRVPAGVEYRRGGSEVDGVVSWTLPRLDTGELAEFTLVVYIGDVMEVDVVNDDYGACSDEEVCQAGRVLTRVVEGPWFEAFATVDPIAHKPGGGTGTDVTPVLVVRNLGPGNARDAMATLFFDRISVQAKHLYADPPVGTPQPFPDGPECGAQCRSYVWVGDLDYGETVTFTTVTAQNTIIGKEGTLYTATVVITDALINMTTSPVSDTAIGLVTHFANVVPAKSAPPVVGLGELLTYTIEVYNRGLTTELPPVLTDVVPLSTTFVWASDGGTIETISDTDVISWVLPYLSPGEGAVRTFSVRVDDNLISGTQIVNSDYAVFGYGNVVTDAVTSGPPVTTTVREVGLIDSYKEVTPTVVVPGSRNVLTYSVHIVNSGQSNLSDVTVYDLMPWKSSTYQRDAVAGAGQLISDIVSLRWKGDVAGYSSEIVTFTVLVGPYYFGPLTNTAIISHPGLLTPVVVEAGAYAVAEHPMLQISKSARPSPVEQGGELIYTIRLVNLGLPASGLIITDAIPANTEYVLGSATGGGELVGNQLRWQIPALQSVEPRSVAFRVTVGGGYRVVNDAYGIRSAEGAVAVGAPVITRIGHGPPPLYLPLILKSAS
jgi:uncharacterized repeat protein (TIGR01451 family)